MTLLQALKKRDKQDAPWQIVLLGSPNPVNCVLCSPAIDKFEILESDSNEFALRFVVSVMTDVFLEADSSLRT
jgi:hypothetical protein